MKVLGLDFETTGLHSTTDRVIEIGAVVWDTETGRPQAMFSELVKYDGSLSSEIVKITGITDTMLKDYGRDPKSSFQYLWSLIQSCEYVVAHNAPFDRGFLENELRHFEIASDFSEVQWIDTLTDVPYPDSIGSRKLTYLAADHGFLNSNAHRALFDVLTMLNIFQRYSINDITLRAKSPNVQVIAKVSFEEKEKAKKLGFRWNKDDKIWFKDFKMMDLETQNFPFEFEIQS